MGREKRLRELRAEEGWKNGKGKQRSELFVRSKGRGEKGLRVRREKKGFGEENKA